MTRAGVSEELEKRGILLLSDPFLPSVVSLVAGAPVKGSWWGHRRGHEIFRELNRLKADPDSLTTRLVSSKVTFLHRSLWPHFLSVCTSRSGWQVDGLGPAGRKLMARIDKEGELRLDSLGPQGRQAAKELERRLVFYSDELHTAEGYHTKVMSVWPRCPKLSSLRLPLLNPQEGMRSLESRLRGLNEEFGGRGALPWLGKTPRRR